MITMQDATLNDLPNKIYRQNSKNYVKIESRAKNLNGSFLPDFQDALNDLMVKKLKENNLKVKTEDGLIRIIKENIEKSYYNLKKSDVYEYNKFFYIQESKAERKTNLLRIKI